MASGSTWPFVWVFDGQGSQSKAARAHVLVPGEAGGLLNSEMEISGFPSASLFLFPTSKLRPTQASLARGGPSGVLFLKCLCRGGERRILFGASRVIDTWEASYSQTPGSKNEKALCINPVPPLSGQNVPVIIAAKVRRWAGDIVHPTPPPPFVFQTMPRSLLFSPSAILLLLFNNN